MNSSGRLRTVKEHIMLQYSKFMTCLHFSLVCGALKYNERKSSEMYRIIFFFGQNKHLHRVSHFNPEGIALTAFHYYS